MGKLVMQDVEFKFVVTPDLKIEDREHGICLQAVKKGWSMKYLMHGREHDMHTISIYVQCDFQDVINNKFDATVNLERQTRIRGSFIVGLEKALKEVAITGEEAHFSATTQIEVKEKMTKDEMDDNGDTDYKPHQLKDGKFVIDVRSFANTLDALMEKHRHLANQIKDMPAHAKKGQLSIFCDHFFLVDDTLARIKQSSHAAEMVELKGQIDYFLPRLIESMESDDEYEFDSEEVNEIKKSHEMLNEFSNDANNGTRDR